MILKNTDVRVIIATDQSAGAERDSFTNEYDGTLAVKGGSVYVTYTDENELCSIKQQDTKVTITRHRQGSKMVFDTACDTTATAMPIPLDISTSVVAGDIAKGELILKYRLYSGGALLCENTVNIKIEEK